MTSIPQQINIESLGIRKSDVDSVTVLRHSQSHMVCRLACKKRTYILKWFNSPTGNVELDVYSLLERYGVETLLVHRCTDQALLIEDIQFSSSWKLADQFDMDRSETGKAVAKWYRELHWAGRDALKELNHQVTTLRPWISEINLKSLIRAAAVFELQKKPIWDVAIENIQKLKDMYLVFPQTFNYNDFAPENLVLSRGEHHPLRAIVFDYDCFTTGVAYSDWRNVMYSLHGAAKDAFSAEYGSINDDERLLDEPLAILYGIVTASRREKTPKWAIPLLETVASGELEGSINKALQV